MAPDGPKWPTEEATEKGQADHARFETWLRMEEYALEMALGGGGLAGEDGSEDDSEIDVEDHVNALLMTCLRDTVVLAFRSGYSLEEDPHPMDDDLRAHTYDLLNMALCMSDEHSHTQCRRVSSGRR